HVQYFQLHVGKTAGILPDALHEGLRVDGVRRFADQVTGEGDRPADRRPLRPVNRLIRCSVPRADDELALADHGRIGILLAILREAVLPEGRTEGQVLPGVAFIPCPEYLDALRRTAGAGLADPAARI